MSTKHFHESLSEFLSYILSEKGYAKNTKITYERILTKFISFLIVEEVNFSQVNSDIFTRYIRSLDGLCSNSIRLVVEACKTFFKFLNREGIIKENPLYSFSRPSIWKKVPDILSVEEIEFIIDSLRMETHSGALYRSIIELMYGSGLRVSEVCRVKVSDIQNGMILIRSGKGGKDRLVPYSNVFFNTICEYWKRYRHPFPKSCELAFISPRDGLSMNRIQIFCAIKRIMKKCGIHKNISPHSFRHAFATHLLKNGANIRVVQELLGHESIRSTEIYLHLNFDDVKRSFEQVHQKIACGS